MNVVLSTAYWPNLHYFVYVLGAEKIFLERHEHYIKQSYRNRTTILSANGKLDLVIPVVHKTANETISQLEISYAENWQIKHWRAITSAYKNSPFFEFFEDEIKPFYFEKHLNLFEFNTEQLKLVFKILRVKKKIDFTSEFHKSYSDIPDLRSVIQPKADFTLDQKVSPLLQRAYYQTFASKFGFTPDLSILDLLFNEGLQSKNYFPRETFTL